ncbi:amidohydrolase [Rothia nasimurium]|uniref:Amidohydrolase n=1 Tax=Rothia nasimurium TaxID=85336 RepID=A0A4Y9F695_9MICC|nr:amidohydrolase [Rothia nasimurium]MBF0807229.1 amidohydrolase [Rothia nasimurium]TFU23975.1 amidohydrolase [Rothia nasimurium]
MSSYSFAASSLDLSSPLFAQRLRTLVPELIAFRREVHQNPELSYLENKTTERIFRTLTEAGLAPKHLKGTGCYVDVGSGPMAAALRADIDALPIQEETDLPYASQVDGVMHACGHDIHQTVMLGVAIALHRLHQELPLDGTVRIIFQPAEEQLPGGAVDVIAQGILEGVPRAFALHCEPKVDVGKIGTRIGAITSASDTIKITLKGRGGHTSRPHLTEDVIYALSQIAINVPAVLSRKTDVRSGVLVAWGQIEAGVAPNAIPSTAFLAGTMRCLDAYVWKQAGAMLDEVVDQIAAPYNVEVELEHYRGVPPSVNTEDEVAMIEAASRAELGEDSVVLVEQSMGGEDFAWMLQEVPGALIRLGTRVPGGVTYDLHRGDYVPDERAIEYGVQVMAATALRAIRQESTIEIKVI